MIEMLRRLFIGERRSRNLATIGADRRQKVSSKEAKERLLSSIDRLEQSVSKMGMRK